jgi:hypothetical protein
VDGAVSAASSHSWIVTLKIYRVLEDFTHFEAQVFTHFEAQVFTHFEAQVFFSLIVTAVIPVDIVLLQTNHQQGLVMAVKDDAIVGVVFCKYSFSAQHHLKLSITPQETLRCRMHDLAPCELALKATDLLCHEYTCNGLSFGLDKN